MADKPTVFELANSHLVLHLLAPGEEDVRLEEEGAVPAPADGEAGSVGRGEATPHAPLPENLADDFVDEATDMIDEVGDSYSEWSGWERPLVYGFVDGVLAVADGSWSTLEDSYFEDARNPDFAAVDGAIDNIASTFEGQRPWDEAVKGYVRSAVGRTEEGAAGFDVPFWTLCAHGFFFGADAAYDLEWKVVVTPAGNALLTDEGSLNEVALAQLEAQGSGSLMDRVFNMMGIDPDELAAAFAEDDADEGEDADKLVLEGDSDAEPAEDGVSQ